MTSLMDLKNYTLILNKMKLKIFERKHPLTAAFDATFLLFILMNPSSLAMIYKIYTIAIRTDKLEISEEELLTELNKHLKTK